MNIAMEENGLSGTKDKPVDGSIRLRVDTAGLSESTRRELGLDGLEGADKRLPAGRERELPGKASGGQRSEAGNSNRAEPLGAGPILSKTASTKAVGDPLPSRSFPREASRASRHYSLERTENPEMGKHHLHPTREVKVEAKRQNEAMPLPTIKRQSVEGGPVGRSPDLDAVKHAGELAGESTFVERGDHRWSRQGEPRNGVEPGWDGADQRPGNELFGNGYNPTRADDSKLLRPGRAHSGAGAGEPPPSGPERAPTGGREEMERWQELHAAVKQNVANHQQTQAAMLQALRSAVQFQRAQQAEVERLAAQVRTLLAQNANAGFNRQ